MLNSTQHNISKAISDLRNNVKGFLVKMPLDWGSMEKNTPPAPKGMNQLIAVNDKTVKGAVRG